MVTGGEGKRQQRRSVAMFYRGQITTTTAQYMVQPSVGKARGLRTKIDAAINKTMPYWEATKSTATVPCVISVPVSWLVDLVGSSTAL